MSTSGLSAAEYAKALEAARAHERNGDWQRALDWFRRLASAEDVVRVLAGRRDFRGAAEYLLQHLPGRGFDTAKLNAEQRKRALTAAHLLARADDTEGAVRLLVSLGEKVRAAEVLEKAGDFDGAAQLREVPRPAPRSAVRPPTAPPLPPPSAPRQPVRNAAQFDAARRLEAQGNRAAALEGYVQAGAPGEAARVASELGQHARAGSLFVQAGTFYEASVCAWRAGDAAKAFELIQRVPATDPKYRQAAADAVRLAMSVSNVSIAFEYFIGPFVESPPSSEKDVETLYALAQLYAKLGLPQNAVEALQRVLAVAPGYRDAAAWVAKLNAIDADRLRQVTEEDHAFERATSTGNRTLGGVGLAPLPDLPDLPPLPAPPLPRPTAPTQPLPQPASGLERTGVMTPMPDGGLTSQARATLAPQQGARVVAGRYQLEKRLGQGGMGEVFRAVDLELNDPIAIKLFIMPEGGADAAIARFKQEAKLARRLMHEHIVRLFDFGVDGGTYFITMELLSGHELRDEMRGPMPPERVVAVLKQALRALHAAHQQGVIHRDIKPENLFITDGDVLKVMDFGIAKGQTGGQNLTQQGTMAGTPKYIAPEQIQHFGSVTPAADQYAMGIVAYEMLCGHAPFDSPDLVPLLMMHVNQAPQPLSDILPSVPPKLEAVVMRMLAKFPEQRFESADAVVTALEAAL